jgi:thiamine biosynthesis lipoprotein
MPDRPDVRRPVAGLRHVEHVMGMAVSIHVRDDLPASVLAPVLQHLRDVDATFSTYRADSEISRLAAGTLGLRECHPDVRTVLDQADALRLRTRGYFDVMLPGPDGQPRLDPSGIVKGWAVDRAAAILERAGVRSFCVNAGGDVVARSHDPSRPWRVGIRHPLDAQTIIAVVEGANVCVATSGAYERGAHIVDPHTGRPPTGLLSITVIGPRLAMVDAFATAAFAMGDLGASWVASQPGYGVYAVNDDLHAAFDEEFLRYRAA